MQIMQACVLLCDGCSTELGGSGEFRSSTEARSAAFAVGWRFPNALKSNGKVAVRTHDVCPECLPSWTPREFTASDRYYRHVPDGSKGAR